MEKPEAFYISVRFWVAALTPFVAIGTSYLLQQLPFLQIDQAQAARFFAALVVAGLTFVIARTFRNTKLPQ